MSNGKYIQIADEYMELGANIKRIRVEYKSQAKYKEKLVVKRAIEDNRHIIILAGEDADDTKAVIEFTVGE